jgi:hypothetical protein
MVAAGIGVAVVAIAVVVAVLALNGGTRADATPTTEGSVTPVPLSEERRSGAPVALPGAAGSTRTAGPSALPAGETTDARTPRATSAGRTRTVTVPAGEPSYADTLAAIEASIADPASATAAMERVSILKERVTLASDVAAAQFVEAKATMLTSGAAKGCALMKAIKRENLGAEWRAELTAGIQDCE